MIYDRKKIRTHLYNIINLLEKWHLKLVHLYFIQFENFS